MFVSEKSLLIFWRSQKSECEPLLAQLLSKMHDLERIEQVLPDLIPKVSQIQIFQGYKTILKFENTDELSLWHVKMFLCSSFPPSPLHFLPPTQPWIFNIVLLECTCYIQKYLEKF